MKHIYMLLAGMLSTMFCAKAENVTRSYVNIPITDVLRDIDSIYTAGNINFIYNELEDFTVTAKINKKTITGAIYDVIGFYPIRVTFSNGDYYLECWHKEPNRLKGRLLDENMSPVEFANVQLFNPEDTTFITGGVSNANGDFVIPVEAKRVLLKTHCMGYLPYSCEYEVGSIGTVRLYTNAKLLREITVEQRQIEYEGDKIVAYPTATQIKHSYDFFSLLSQQPFPGLFVDVTNRSLSLFNGTPIILIDGVKRTTQDLLGIQPKNIKKIEYSMNLPQKYANSGASGVISITLKEPKAAGGSFYANVNGAFTTGFCDADLGATYHQGKSQFTFDYSFNYRNYNNRVVDRDYSYVGDDFRVDVQESGEDSPMYYTQHNFNVGYNYRPDKSLLFSAKVRNSLYSGDKDDNASVKDSYVGNYNRITTTRHYTYTPSLDLYVQKEWKGGHTLEAQVVGSLSNIEYERIYNDEYESGEIVSYPSKVNTDHKSLVSEISYQKTFNRSTAVSIGVQNSLSESENNYELSDYITTLKQNDTYAYLNFIRRFGKVNLNIGTGLKYIKMKNEKNERDFTRNIASFSVAGNPKKNMYIAFTGSYRPKLPSLSQLTDLVQTSNAYLQINGNPELKTSHSLNARLAVAGDVVPRVGITLVNTVNYVIDPMYAKVKYLGNRKFLQYTENFDSWFNYEARLVLTLKEICNRHLTARFETFYNRYQSTGEDWRYSLNSVGMSYNVTGYFGKWTVQLYGRIPYKELGADIIGKTEPWTSATVGFRHKNWFFAASGNMLFRSKGTEYPKWYLSKTFNGYGRAYIKDNANMITLMVRYNLQFGKLFGKNKKRTLNNSDTGAAVMTL